MVPYWEHVRARRRRRFVRRRFAAALAVCALLVLAHGAVAHAHGAHSIERTVVVQPGDTLWGLGERYAPPHADLRRWVYAVERLNHVGGLIVPGQRLRLP